MTRAPADAMSGSEAWPPTTVTDRLLDVLLDTRGVYAAFIVNDFGELLAVRFSPDGPPRRAFAAALEAAAGLRMAANSGLDTPTVVVEFALGFLFARRFRRSHLCIWSKEPLPPRTLELSSRLVAASLPQDERMDASGAAQWDADDQRPTDPWFPDEDWAAPELEGSLRAPAIPHELLPLEQDLLDEPAPPKAAPSGIREIAGRSHQTLQGQQPLQARRSR